MGSFYNHFETKEQLFATAVEAVMDATVSRSTTSPPTSRTPRRCSPVGRFDVEDLDVAVTMAAGALLALGQLLHDQPDRGRREDPDRLTENLLRMLGLPRRQAQRICSLPLPEIDTVRRYGSAS